MIKSVRKFDEDEARTTFRRLLLSKQMFQHGYSHSNNGDALSKMIAVHNFHNSIEITLRAIMLSYEIRAEKQLNIEFEVMLNEIDNFKYFKESNIKLPYRQELRNLNQLRNMVQHHAVEPEASMMDEWRFITKKFLIKSFKEYFEIEFDEISPLFLIDDENLRSLLEISSYYLVEKDWVESACCTKLAFEYASRTLSKFLPEAGFNNSSFILSNLRLSRSSVNRELIRTIEKIFEHIKDTQHHLAIISSGVGLSEYKKFETVTPFTQIAINGYPHFYEKTVNEEDAKWALNFLTELLLNWQTIGLNPSVPDWALKTCKNIIEKQSVDSKSIGNSRTK